MEDSYYEDGMRIVWGRDKDDAEHWLRDAVEVSYSYSLDKSIDSLEMTEATGYGDDS